MKYYENFMQHIYIYDSVHVQEAEFYLVNGQWRELEWVGVGVGLGVRIKAKGVKSECP